MEVEGLSNGGMLYHEIQESKLCALHCVNTLLQGPFFSELDLAALASDLDRTERQMMLEGVVVSDDFLLFDSEESHNVSMDGDFSIQVWILLIFKDLVAMNLEDRDFVTVRLRRSDGTELVLRGCLVSSNYTCSID
ncbi:hypothetical protein HHK36_016262 [Tetracentron sinense]|uniref:ubiquitinyl hydrolase 1 n=1 Tax=Tetracentron sinense TaxID=13715 RepID=A0A834YWV6_TETSI|nr:hypothetical protein HHK36_016262 [Tetracentron sinense]